MEGKEARAAIHVGFKIANSIYDFGRFRRRILSTRMDLHGSFSSAEAAASVYVVEGVNSEYMRFPLPVLLSPLREARKLCGTRAKSGSRAQARVFAEVHWVGEADARFRRRQCRSINVHRRISFSFLSRMCRAGWAPFWQDLRSTCDRSNPICCCE